MLALFLPFLHSEEILTVCAYRKGATNIYELFALYPSQVEGDLFRTSNLETLTLFKRPHEARRFNKGIRRTGIQPRITTPHLLDTQLPLSR